MSSLWIDCKGVIVLDQKRRVGRFAKVGHYLVARVGHQTGNRDYLVRQNQSKSVTTERKFLAFRFTEKFECQIHIVDL